ncbi:hypothetical protein [Sphingopyxis sp.]|uniref:hypothetical protein n=1 Tax=Sphingopyxis sp. TaxID=1908224 RepID=UPI003D14BC9E
MRADMFKVIVERPRWASRHAASVKLKRSDPGIHFIGHKRHAKTAAPYHKHLNENLAPLIRFLRSRRGRRWDDVFAEICAGLDTGSTVKMHVRQHLDDFVASRISIGRHGEWLFDGRVLGRADRWGWRRWSFFVDPADGILRDGADLAWCLPPANRATKGGPR